MMEELKNCLVCGSENFTHQFRCVDFVATKEMFQIQRCASCGFLFTNPRPASQDISRYYKTDNYVSHAKNKSGLIYHLYDIVRNRGISQKLRLIKKYHRSGNLLDLGCGLGNFLHGVLKDGVFTGTGADISEEAIAFVKQKYGLTVKSEKELDLIPDQHFEIITQWHVLEHVHLLNERMAQLKRLLQPGGTLFIAVPNSDSFDAGYYKNFWDAFDVPRHLYHFNRVSFKKLMLKHGFEIIETRPLLFDAPYVSMRSEQHQNHPFSFFRGAFIGFVSNISALFNGNYSSLLFVVKAKA